LIDKPNPKLERIRSKMPVLLSNLKPRTELPIYSTLNSATWLLDRTGKVAPCEMNTKSKDGFEIEASFRKRTSEQKRAGQYGQPGFAQKLHKK
jgi:hypothetical protein